MLTRITPEQAKVARALGIHVHAPSWLGLSVLSEDYEAIEASERLAPTKTVMEVLNETVQKALRRPFTDIADVAHILAVSMSSVEGINSVKVAEVTQRIDNCVFAFHFFLDADPYTRRVVEWRVRYP